MKKQFKRISKMPMMAISIVVAILAVVALTISFAAQEISVSILQTPEIDIALAKSRTSVDLGNFKQNLLDALSKKGVDANKVNIIDVESTEANIQTSFTWQQNVSPSIGSISVTNGGRDVVMYGNSSNPGKNAIWIMNDSNADEKFTFDYSINFGDSFNAAGMLLNIKQVNATTLEGYMLSFNNGNWRSASGGYNGAIWKFTYVLNTNNQNFNKTLVKGLNITTSGTLSVTASDGLIEITGGGLANEKVTLPTIYGKGFGFFSDHYSHGCNNIGNFNLRNIRLDLINYKKISETLREPNWRDNALRLMVNVDDYSYENFDDDSYLSEIITRATNDDLYYLAWGTDANKADATELINSIDGKGTFVNNTDYTKAIDDTAQYIYELLGGSDVGNTYCLGDKIDFDVSPAELKTNTADENWPNGRWKVDHQYDYYENNNGQYAKTGVYTSDLNIDFDKVGRYVITYEDNNIVPTEIFVHRKPVASFNITRTGNIYNEGTEDVIGSNIDLTSSSYDLDKLSDNDGIQEEDWSYKTVGDTNWTSGKLDKVRNDTTYLVRLRVKDFQDKWSDYETKYISANSGAPIASFSIKDSEITLYEKLDIIDSSYDPSGKELTTYNWKVLKDKDNIYMGSTPLLDYKEFGKGTYTIELTVTNSDGTTSESYAQKFNVIDDTIAPEVIADPISDSVTNKAINVHLLFTDQGGSGFAYFKYAISDSQYATESDLDWSGKLRSNEYDVKVSEVGDNYIYVKAVDNAENESQIRILGDYSIEQTSFDVNLQLTDFDNPNILLGDAKFTLIQPKKGIFDERKTIDGVTDVTGKITFKASAMDVGTYDYILYETEAPTDYESIALGAVRVTFDADGNISKVEKVIYSSDLLEIKDDYSATEMNLLVKNKTLESAQNKTGNSATLNISVVDEKDPTLPLSGAIYSVTTESNDKNWSMTNILTDQYGKIAVPIQGEGNIRISIVEDEPKTGYTSDSSEKVIIVNVKNGNLQYIISKQPDSLASSITTADNSANVTITSNKKEQENQLQVKLVDATDNNTSITGVSFDMTLPDGSTMSAVTDHDGYATFDAIPKDLGEGTKIFTFKQTSSTFGYVDTEETPVKVTFTDGLITGIDDTNTDNVMETVFKVNDSQEDNKVYNNGTVTIGLGIDPAVDKYQFVLTLEEANTTNVIAGARYKITIQNGEDVKTVIGTTNKNGEIKTNVLVSDDIRIYVEELVSAVGYAPSIGEQAIQIGKDENGDLEIISKSNLKQDPYISKENKAIKFYDENETRSVSNVSKLAVYITKVDEYNSKIQNLKVKVTSAALDEPQKLTTDKNGRISLKDIEPASEGTYDFIITELDQNGIENLDSTIKLRIKYQYLEGFLQVTGIQVLQGNKYVKSKEYANYQALDNYQSDVKVTTYAKGEVDADDSDKLGITSVDFVKLDAKGNKINGAEYSLSVTRPDGTVLMRDGIAIDNTEGTAELPAMYIPNGSLIEINETKAPIGYSLDKNTSSYKVTLDEETNEMELDGGPAKSEVSQTQLSDGRTRYAMKFTVADNVLAPTYKVNIQKSTENELFTAESKSEYNVIVRENNSEKINDNYTTDAKGLVTIDKLNAVGKIDIFVNEKNEAPIRAQLTRSDEDYSFTVEQDPTTVVDPNDTTVTRKVTMEVDDTNQVINIKIQDQANLKLNIKNTDFQYQTGVPGVIYAVTVDELDAGNKVVNTATKHTVASDASGEIELKLYKKYINQSIRLTFHEESALTNYDPNEDVIVTLKYNSLGYISKYTCDNDESIAHITNNPTVDQGLSLETIHKRLDGLNIGITAIDSVTNADYVQGAKFTITEDFKNTTCMTDVTDGNGLATKVVGTKLYDKVVNYTIKNVTAGDEYKQLTEDISFNVTYTEDGLIDKSSIEFVSGQDICTILDNDVDTSANDLELLIAFIPKDKFFVNVEMQDAQSGMKIANLPFDITSSYNKKAEDISTADGTRTVNVGYVADGLTVNYTLNTGNTIDKYASLKNEKFSITYDENGYIAANGCATSSTAIQFKDDLTGSRTAKIILKIEPKVSVEINAVDSFNNSIKIVNSKFKISATTEFNAEVTTDTDGKAIAFVAPFGKGSTVEYAISETASNEAYTAVNDGRMYINFDSKGAIIGTPSVEGMKNAVVEVVGQGTLSEPNIRITIPNEPKVRFSIESIESNSGVHLPLVGDYTITSDKTGEVGKFNSEGIGSVGSFGTNETINYTITQSNVPNGYTKHEPFKVQVTFDENQKISKAIKENANNNDVIVNRQDSTDNSNKWYTGNDKGAVEVKIKNYPLITFNITNKCSSDNSLIEDAMFTIVSSENLNFETEKSNAQGQITALAGETKEGTISYTIKQQVTTLGFKNLPSDIEIQVKYDANGYITAESKNPRIVFGNEVGKITNSGNLSIDVSVYNERVDGVGMGLESQDAFNTSIKLAGISYSVSKVKLGGNNAILESTALGTISSNEFGLSDMQLGNFQNETAVIRLQQTSSVATYEKQPLAIMVSAAYDADGKIVGTPAIVDGNAYVDIKKCSDYYFKLTLKHYPKLLVSANSMDRFDTEKGLVTSFKVTDYYVDSTTYKPGYICLADSCSVTTNAVKEYTDNYLGGIRADTTRTYWISAESGPSGYQYLSEYMGFSTGYPNSRGGPAVMLGAIYVTYDTNGQIVTAKSSDNDKIQVEVDGEHHIRFTTKYTKLFTLTVNAIDDVKNSGIAKTYALSPRAYETRIGTGNGSFTYVWANQPRGQSLNQKMGETTHNNYITYNIGEYRTTEDKQFFYIGNTSIRVQYDEKGNISAVTDTAGDPFKASDGLSATFEGTHATLNIRYSTKFLMYFKTADATDSSKKTAGVYRITSNKGDDVLVSDSNKTLIGKKYPGETVRYKVDQVQVGSPYILNTDTMYMDITFLPNGTQVVETRGNNDIKKDIRIDNNEEQMISATVFNWQRTIVNLDVHDDLFTADKLEGAKFSVTSSKNDEAVNSVITDANGIAQALIGKACANETVEYTIKQLNTLPGYYPNDKVVKLQAVYDNRGNVSLVKVLEGQDIATITTIPNGNRTIDLELTNHIKDINLGVETVDKITGKGVKNVSYSVTKSLDGKDESYDFISMENGEDITKVDEYDGAKTVIYTVTQNSISGEYTKLAEPIKFKVVYNEKSEPISYAMLSNIDNRVSIAIPTDKKRPTMNNSGKRADIKVSIIADNSHSIKFSNVDNRFNTLPVDGSQFKCSIKSDDVDFAEYDAITTDKFGVATYNNLTDKGTIRVHFEQLSAGPGYKNNLNNSGDVVLEKKDNTMRIVSTNVPEDIKVSLNPETRQLEITVQNETDVTLQVVRTDNKSKTQLAGSKMRIYQKELDSNGKVVNTKEIGSVDTNITGEDGKLEYKLGNSPVSKTYQYEFDEIESPAGYDVLSPIIVTVVYDGNGMVKGISDNSPAAQCTQPSKLTLLTGIDSGIGDIGYAIHIRTVDDETNKGINGSTINAKLSVTDETNKTTQVASGNYTTQDIVYGIDAVMESGTAPISNIMSYGALRLEFSETKRADGYLTVESEKIPTYNLNFKAELVKLDGGNKAFAKLTIDENGSNTGDLDVNLDEDNKVITITYLNKANPAYKVKVLSVDKDDDQIRKAGQKLNVKITNALGTDKSVDKSGETAGNGEFDVDDIKGFGDVHIEIKQTENPGLEPATLDFYRDPEERTFYVSKTKGLRCEIDPKTCEVTIYYLNKQQDGKYSILLNNVTPSENKILGVFQYSVTDPDGNAKIISSDEDGKMVLDELAVPQEKGKADYKFKLQDAPEICPEDMEIEFNLSIEFDYDESGNLVIKDATTSDNAVADIVKTADQLVKVNIIADAQLEYNVKIISVDSDDHDLRKADQSYKVTINNEFGTEEPIEEEITTAGNGEYTMENIIGYGNITIQAEELDNPAADIAEIKMFRDPETMVMKANSANGIDYDIENETNTITLYILSKQDEGNYSVVLNNLSKRDKPILDEFTYVVTDEKGNSKQVVSDENGIVAIPGFVIPSEPGTVDLKFECIEKPGVCDQDEDTGFTLSIVFDYDKDRFLGITQALIQGSSDVELNKVRGQLVKLNVKHTADDALPLYNLKVVNVDANDPDWRIANTAMNITIENEFGEEKKEISDVTSGTGEISIEGIDGYGNITITVAQEGVTEPDVIKLSRDELTGLIKGESANIDYDIKNEESLVVLYVINKTSDGKYSVVFNNLDMSTQSIIEDVFEYELTTDDGKSQMISTNDKGRLELRDIDLPEVSGDITYTVRPVYVPTGYVLNNSDIKLTVGFDIVDQDMQIVSAKIDGDNAKVEKQTAQFVKVNIINTTDPNAFAKYAIIINKVDADTKANIAGETELQISLPNGEVKNYKTDEDGRLELLNIDRPQKEGTYLYEIREITPPEGYQLLDEAQVLAVTFAKNPDTGEMVVVEATIEAGTHVELNETNSNNVISLNLMNRNDSAFDMQIINVDVDDYDYRIPNTEFNVTVTDEHGETVSDVTDKTGPDGAIFVNDIEAYGNLKVNIHETNDLINGDINLNRNIETGLIGASSANNVDYMIDNDKHMIYVYVLNYQPEDNYTVVLSNSDSATNEVIKDVFEYEVTDPEGNKQEIATSANGRLELTNLVMPVNPEKVEYTIEPLYSPAEYKFSNDKIKLSVEFDRVDAKMQIVNATLVEGKNANIVKFTKQLVKVNVSNEADPDAEYSLGKYGIVLNNTFNDKNIITESEFDITAPDGTIDRYTTDEDGKVSLLNIEKPNKAGTYDYKIKAITTYEGCEEVTDEQVLSLTFDIKDNKVVLNDKKVTKGNNLKVAETSSDNIIQVNFLNHKAKTTFNMQVINVDPEDYDYRISNAEFNVIVNAEDGVGKNVTATTDATGMIEIPNVDAYGDVSIDVKATNNLISGNIKLNRNRDTDVMTVSSVQDVDYVVDNDKQMLCVYILNKQPANEYILVLANVDSESRAAIQDSFEYEISAEGRTKQYTSNANGRVELSKLEMPDSPQSIEYTVKPIYIPTGYIFSKTGFKVNVTFDRVDGEMQIVKAEITEGNNVEVEKTGKQLVKVNVLNEIDTNNPYTSGKYAIVINNKYAATNTNILQVGTFDVTSPDGTLTSYTTNDKGRAELLNIAKPDKAGTYYYTIKQTAAPDGFPLVEEEQQLAITFDIVDNKVVIINTAVSSGNSLSIEPTKNANVIQVDFLNAKDSAGDLYLKVGDYEILNAEDAYAGNLQEYESGDIYLNRIEDKTVYEDFINKLDTNATKVTIVNQKGEEITSDAYVGTGMVMTLEKEGSQDKIQLMLVVTGDLTGNGKVGIVDTSRIESHYLNIKHLDQLTDNQALITAYMKAADVNNNGKITIVDTSKVSSYYLKLTDKLYVKK